MIKKIGLCLILGLVMVGAVYAIDSTSFQVPADFEDVGDGVYVEYDNFKNPLQILSVVEHSEFDAEDYLSNDTENNYTVWEGENNTFNFVDGSMDEKGTFEVIEVDGVKFIVDFAKRGIDNENDFNETLNNLLEFNRLNNVTPVNVTEETN